MKNLLITICLVLLLCASAYGTPISGSESNRIGPFSGDQAANQDDNIKASLDLAHTDLDAILLDTGTTLNQMIADILGISAGGVAYYVDSGAGAGSGTGLDWTNASETLDEAIVLMQAASLANTGSIIFVAAGHAETLTAADDVDFDFPDLKVYGQGVGENAPTFTYSTNGEVSIAADDIELHNLNFIAGNAVTHAIDVESGSENYVINNCRFWTVSVNTDEFTDCIDVVAGADNGKITNNEFEMGAASAVSAISHVGSDFTEISGNLFTGDFSTAAIEDSATISLWMIIKDNVIVNGDTVGGLNAVAAISLKADTSALILDNKIFCDMTEAGSIVAAVGYLVGNTYNETAGSGTFLEVGKSYVRISNELLTTNAARDMFNVLGGQIHITSMVGVCTTVIASTPGVLDLHCDATTENQDRDFTTAVNCDSVTAGSLITFDSVTAGESVLVVTLDVGASEPVSWFCPIGMIEQRTNTTGTGGFTWYMTFTPIVDGVTVTVQ